MDKNRKFNELFDETFSSRVKRMSTEKLLQALTHFTFSDNITNEELDTLVKEDPNTEAGEIAAITIIVRELKSRK